jgi:DNA-binding transcriptional ArsR family regulator
VKKADRQAAALKALGEPRRVEILRVLLRGPRGVTDLAQAINVTQQAASQHLAVLDRAGLVEATKVGTRRLYAVRPDGFAPVAAFVESFWGQRLKALKLAVEEDE